jgi:hypothetical protein
MGFLSGMTDNFYRYTRDGRRVWGLPILPGLSTKWYVVSDDFADLIERRFRWFFVLTFCFAIPITSLWASERLWIVPLIALVWTPIAMRFWVLRGAPKIAQRKEDLEPVDRRSRDLAQMQAMGEPKLWFLLMAALAMAVLDVFVLATDGDWWAWLGLIMFGTGVVMMARAILLVRRANRR